MNKLILWLIGIWTFFIQFNADVFKWVWRHLFEALMALTIIGMFIVPNAMNNGAMNYFTALIIMGILACLFIALIRIKILETRGEKKNDRHK